MRRMFSRNQLLAIIGNFILAGGADDQINGLIDDSIEDGAIKTELDKKANLSGAAFTGAITAPSIIEDMSGYSYSNTNADFSPAYAGAVKNGNKVTLVIAGTLTPPTLSTYYYLGNFKIPETLYDKLFPIDSSNIAYPTIELTVTYASKVTSYGTIEKTTDNRLRFGTYVTSAATANQAYYLRVEVTFLLSDNLAEE